MLSFCLLANLHCKHINMCEQQVEQITKQTSFDLYFLAKLNSQQVFQPPAMAGNKSNNS